MTHHICVHTDDKKYSELQIEPTEFSSQSLTTITHGTTSNTNALNNQIWDDSETIYWTNDTDYEFISEKDQIKLIKLALLESSFQTPLVIRQRKRKSADAQLKINWLKMKDERYFKSTGTLAFGYGPGRGLGGDVTMNADVLWLLRKPGEPKLTVKEAFDLGYIENYDKNYPDNIIKTYDPLHTMKHEAGGHAMGMRHITDVAQKSTAIMYPYYNGLRKFGDADKNYLWDLYGKASLSHKIKEILLKRIQGF